ncbi:DgyrCDS6999 [Dimorphilus gyrociliatus]|uniref:Inositol 1,4,5-trisphosphate receptor n=1 Tax=Dimorphilus gyrociliatus TaxID=2664684 RepID=A0A7I8VPP3_9ANNE|nr:DgyrCDS6999 [Dimorphilus gyrociliatus]
MTEVFNLYGFEEEETKSSDIYMAFGDYVCLYCDQTNGYVYSDRTRTNGSGLFTYHNQEKDCPQGLDNIQAITFQLFTPNRYKFNKKYRKLKAEGETDKVLASARIGANAETKDNLLDQQRVKGKLIKYGEIVQLRHAFSSKFIHVSKTDNSTIEKNRMLVTLEDYNAKTAQFRILPRCKVKTEGDKVEFKDEILFESVKMYGSYLHVSYLHNIDNFTRGSEVNLGVDYTYFSIKLHFRPSEKNEKYLRGGDIVRFYHKDLEAYLCAEGVFGESEGEDVHFRVRSMDQLDYRTLYPPISGIVYWQIENVNCTVSGEGLKWEEQIRLRHSSTRKYLMVSEEKKASLTDNSNDSRTIFVFHNLGETCYTEEIEKTDTIRIEHVVTGFWLHGQTGDFYERQTIKTEGVSLASLSWDNADLIRATATDLALYPDAFVIQDIQDKDIQNFNYVAGLIPFFRDIAEQRRKHAVWKMKDQKFLCEALTELENFLIVDGQPSKNRQKLLRNTKLLDLLVKILKFPYEGMKDAKHLLAIFVQIYNVLRVYTEGKSKKNSIYCARYIDIFTEHLSLEGEISETACLVLINLFRDNRKIIDRIDKERIIHFIALLHKDKNHRMLELLGTLSVCNEIAMTKNQNLIAEQLFVVHKSSMFHLSTSQDINEPYTDFLYVSVDDSKTWIALHKFLFKSSNEYDERKYSFLQQQLKLYKELCYGINSYTINIVTKTKGLFTWETAFVGLKSEIIPDALRAIICDLLIDLFVDLGGNDNMILLESNNFVYDEVHMDSAYIDSSKVAKDMDSDFPSLHVWIRQFFKHYYYLTANQCGRSLLIEKVLRLVTYLIMYGFMGSNEDINELMEPVLSIVSGFCDKPFAPDNRNYYSRYTRGVVYEYQLYKRYEKCKETDAIVSAKIQGLELLELLLTSQFNGKVKFLIALFKDTENKIKNGAHRHKLKPLLENSFDANQFWEKSYLRKAASDVIRKIDKQNNFLESKLPKILLDLTKYEADDLLIKSLSVLNRFYSSKFNLFDTTSRSLVLCSVHSTTLHREVLVSVLRLKHLFQSQLNEENSKEIVKILLRYKEICHEVDNEHVPFKIGQNILVNNGVLTDVKNIITQEVDKSFEIQHNLATMTIRAALTCLRYMTNRNEYVQSYVFAKLEDILKCSYNGSELALLISEVFKNNLLHCLRITPNQISKIIKMTANNQERAPEFLLLLSNLVKDEMSGIVVSRNKLIVAQVLMENYQKVAYTMEWKAKKSSAVESGADELTHNEKFWKHIMAILTIINRLIDNLDLSIFTESEFSSSTPIKRHLSPPNSEAVSEIYNSEQGPSDVFNYLFNGGFELLQSFISKFYKAKTALPIEQRVIRKLTESFQTLYGVIMNEAKKVSHLLDYCTFLQILLVKTGHDPTVLSNCNSDEEKFNEMLLKFTNNLMVFVEGRNTVQDQLGLNRVEAYNHPDLVMYLPLGSEFQEHVMLFRKHGSKKGAFVQYAQAQKLIEYLKITGKKYITIAPKEIEVLDKRCLQILRAIVYNEILLLTGNWGERKEEFRENLDKIRSIQLVFCQFGIVPCLICLLSRQSDQIRKEVLALIDVLLFNAPKEVQDEILKYFESTKEEPIFFVLRNYLSFGSTVIKERRAMEKQLAEREKKLKTVERKKVLTKEEEMEERKTIEKHLVKMALRKNSLPLISFTRSVLADHVLKGYKKEIKEIDTEEGGFYVPAASLNQTPNNLSKFKEDGTIALVLRVLAGMCDGQYIPLQSYLCEQPDNITSINIVAEVAQFLGIVYSRINDQTIKLVTQLITCLREMCQGYQPNRAVILNNKVIDFTNYILRMSVFKNCNPLDVIRLRQEIASLITALTEESSPEAFVLSMDISDRIDLHAIKRVICQSHMLRVQEKPNYLELVGDNITPVKNLKRDPEIDDSLKECSFLFTLVLARFFDIDTSSESRLNIDEQEKAILEVYKGSCQSVEIIKDDHIQKVHFRVKNMGLLREDLKEDIKWNIDRSSPSGKLRDLISWTKDILADISYQKKLLNNKFLKFVAKISPFWQYLIILVSLTLNIIMLISWEAPERSTESIPVVPNLTTIPTTEFQSSVSYSVSTNTNPVITTRGGTTIPTTEDILIAKEVNNIFNNSNGTFSSTIDYFTTESYTTATNATPPITYTFANENENQKKEDTSKGSRIIVKMISGQTLLYIIFAACSALGTYYYGYFFAVHLLLIVQGNQLLLGIIRAVTMNGKSLVWVAILGLVTMYLFALAVFAFFREAFDIEEEVYCDTLAKCSYTVLRYGLIGNYDEGFYHHVHFEHNMWSYVNYFIYLDETAENDYSAIDLYVVRMLESENLEFFPTDRALCLANLDEDSKESKLDNVIKAITDIRNDQIQQEMKERRHDKRLRIIKWQELYSRNKQSSITSSSRSEKGTSDV